MGGGGGGGGWNPFENVSWNKPFGDSVASNLVGGAGGVDSMFQGVSMDKPFGDTSSLGLALYGNTNAPLTSTGVDKQTGEQYVPNPDAPPGAEIGLPSPPASTPTPSAPTSNIPMAYNPGALPKYLNNAAETAYRNQYLKGFNPNVNFNLNAEQSPFKNISQGSIGNTLSNALSRRS